MREEELFYGQECLTKENEKSPVNCLFPFRAVNYRIQEEKIRQGFDCLLPALPLPMNWIGLFANSMMND